STSDPQFISAPTNFALQSTSPAINQGTPLGSPFDIDPIGTVRPQGAGWDIGAYEFVAPGPGPKIYWVSTTGNNNNSCQSASGTADPSVYKRDLTGPNGGISCMAPGDTLKIKGGTYSEYLRYDISGLTL